MFDDKQLAVEYVPIDRLVPYKKNARTHSDAQVAQIVASIKEFGWTNPILTDGENGIIAGHGRLMAARQLGLTDVPVIELAGLTDVQKQAYVLADNQLALNAGWDAPMLASELQELSAAGFDLDLIGFADLDALMADKTEGLTDPDDVPEAPKEPVTVLGDVWLLGKHRIVCGDSTDADVVEKCLNGIFPDLVYTDPPYGINEKGDRSGRKTGLAANHNFADFKDDSVQYAIDAYNICESMNIKRQVWWGANYYCHSLPLTNNWFVWDKRVETKMHDTQSDCELAWVKSKWSSVRIFRHLWKGFNKDSERGESRVHPTQKPIALAEWVFDYYKDVKTVFDLFLGSGSTLIACEKTNRTAYCIELSTIYSDVSVIRWQDFTGQTATLEGDGRTFTEIAESRNVPLRAA